MGGNLSDSAGRRWTRLGLAVFVAAALPAGASAEPIERFAAWLQDVRGEAGLAGVSERTLDEVFSGLAPDCAQTGVFCGAREAASPPLSRRTGLPQSCDKVPQREFLEPAAYFPEDYLRRLVRRGQALLGEMRERQPEVHARIQHIERSYGVPIPALMGLWARETAFGAASLDHNAITAIASLAFAGAERRRSWYRMQLVAGLRMIERGAVTLEAFRSSWAGATGLTQLMPAEYLEYGADGDGDGRVDVWTSAPDALATTAHLLTKRGWRPDMASWGREVSLPAAPGGFDCTLEGRASRMPAARWAAQFGIAPLEREGRAAEPRPDALTSYLLLPAGAAGPAFLVTENFDALRAYNPSDLYALFVGHIAERLGCDDDDGACGFQRPWPERTPDSFEFSVETICRLQLGLIKKGVLAGEADGLFGPQTRTAIGRYQKSRGLAPTCYPTRPLYQELTGAMADVPPGEFP
jgi:lytic murein transglycosylase